MPSLSFCLARGLSILLVFSKNEHMVLLIYSIIWLFSILISTLMLLSLDFICYSFYDFLRWIFRSLIFNFSSFLIYFNLINFPLTRGLAASHEFFDMFLSLLESLLGTVCSNFSIIFKLKKKVMTLQ